LKDKGDELDTIVLLQPTSPHRSEFDIDSAVALMLDRNCSAVISVINIGIKSFKSYYLNEKGFLQGAHNIESPNMRRQELPDAYLANGAIYAVSANEFLINKSLIPQKTIPFIMENEKSIDIDTIEDVRIVEDYIISNC
jgi:CMP-N,N'-diacetyllegionaminic acid synthase